MNNQTLKRRLVQLRPASVGFLMGGYFWLCAMALGINFAVGYAASSVLIWAGLIGAVLNKTKLRRILWIAPASITVLYLLVAFTPIVRGPALGLIRTDPIQKVDAIVVLSAGITPDNLLSFPGLDRLLSGVDLVKQGFASNIVVTRIGGVNVSAEPDQDRIIGLLSPAPKVFRVGRVLNTHEEAQQVTLLAKEQGWKKIILVTAPLHSSRAAATFEMLGLQVISRPCINRQYATTDFRDPNGGHFEIQSLSTVDDRLGVFQHLLYEKLGWWSYRRKGYVK